MEAWVWFTHVHDRGTPSIHMCLQWHTEATPWPSNLRLSLLRRREQAAVFILLPSLFNFQEQPGEPSHFMRHVTHYLTVFSNTNSMRIASQTLRDVFLIL